MNFKLKNIWIKNFLSFKDVDFSNFKNERLIGLKDYNVLIGKNNAGKSNIFKLLIELKEVLRGKNFDINKLFDKKEDQDAQLTLTFYILEEYRRNLFTKLHDEKQFINVFEEPEDCPKEWNEDTLQWLINQGFYEQIELSFSYYDQWNTLILDRVFVQHNGYSYGSILFQLDPYDKENLVYYLIKKEKFINAKNLKSYFKQSFSFKYDYSSSEKINYQDSNLSAHINNLKNNLNYPASMFYNLLFAILLEDIFDILFSKDFIHYIPDKRRFERSSDIMDLDKTLPLPDGSNLSKFLANQAINNRLWLDEFNLELKTIFPYIDEFSSKIEGNNALLHSKEKYLENILRLENLGAGILNVVLFLIYLKYIDEGKILLIEEPELFIFPGLQKRIRDYFLKKSNKNQIFITTHSPHFLSRNFERCSIYHVRKNEAFSQIKMISDNEILSIFKDLGLGLYDFLLYDALIFVEGSEDLKVFKMITKKILKERVRIIECGGKDQFHHYAEAKFLHIMKDHELKFLFIMDLDTGNENIWHKFKNEEYKEELENLTLRLPFYEIENLILQPIFVLDYLGKISKIKLHKIDTQFEWIIDNLERIFIKKGNNNLKYILKKFIDYAYPWFSDDEIDLIIKVPQNQDDKDIYEMWIDKIIEILNKREKFCHISIEDKNNILLKFKEIEDEYNNHFQNKNYNEILSGKEVLKEFKSKINEEYKLSESLSTKTLTKHLIEFLIEFLNFTPDIVEDSLSLIRDESLLTCNSIIKNFNSLKIENINSFQNYCQKVINLIQLIENKLEINLKGEFKNLELFEKKTSGTMLEFLFWRWNLI